VRWPIVAEEIAFALTYGAGVRKGDLPPHPQLGPAISARQYTSAVAMRS
jgi:hypothetical protein